MNRADAEFERLATLSDEEWEARFGPCATEEGLALEAELRWFPLREVGPSMRDSLIYEQLEFAGRSAESLAEEHGLAPRTIRTIARATLRWSARRQVELDRMTLAELYDEDDRFELLAESAMAAFWSSFSPERRVSTRESARGTSTTTLIRPRVGLHRYSEIGRRVTIERIHLRHLIDRRIEEMLAEEARLARVRVRTVPRRTRRRKAMGGRRFQLPRFVRTARIARSAAAWNIELLTSPRGKLLVGIPPPDS